MSVSSTNVYADIVKDAAMESVGGIENSISDGVWAESNTRNPTRDELIEYVKIDVDDECPSEIRFLSNKVITKIIESEVDGFEYTFGAPVGE